jgi:hypothetical protein
VKLDDRDPRHIDDELDTTKELFVVFSAEVRYLHTSWVMWRQLFEREPRTREDITAGNEAYRVTGAASELFFRYVRWHMLAGTILDLCRLCDSKTTGGRQNLTIERVFEQTDFSEQEAVRLHAQQAMEQLIRIVRDKSGIAGLRNQALAHLDLERSLGSALPADVETEWIREAVDWIVQFHHLISIARRRIQFHPASVSSLPDRSLEEPWKASVDSLVRVLANGLKRTNK